MPPGSKAKPKANSRVALPTGTVTFLFSDIEGSTQRWESNRAAMDAAVKRHDALMRSALEQHNGFVFKTVGDAFCVAFARVSDAMAAAIEAQRASSAEDFSAVGGLRVRMAVHTGEASERNGDYFGPALNRVARLVSIGHGGQVLLSSATRELVHADLAAGSILIDLGLHRLKDLAEPERVWQLTASGLQVEFPGLQSLAAFPNNLPVQLTSLRGRERDIKETKSLLGEHRLLTLVGSGGVGKTRLALQTGADLLELYPDGVWLADLAPVSDPELVASLVAKVLEIGQPEGRAVSELIPSWARRKRLLLILDNCEHVVNAVANLAESILRAAPEVHVLSTSRQALGIAGEFVYRLPSLELPDQSSEAPAETAMQYGGIALFVDRAVASDMRFRLTDDNVSLVAAICRRLDGIPFAIELAAARVKVLSLANLAQRLDERFKILVGSHTALPRQKTLTSLIDWSYDLLSPEEQKLLERVSVFAGGFDLYAAAHVCSGDPLDEGDIFELLTSLVDKSLVAAETSVGNERFELLESTRAYALEKLGVLRERFARRHAEYFLDRAKDADEAFSTSTRSAYLAGTEPNIDNFRAVLDWSLAKGNDIVLGASLVGRLSWLWYLGGFHAEARWWLTQAQRVISEAADPAVAARLWATVALLTSGKRSFEAGERARQLYANVGDRRRLAWAYWSNAYALKQMGRLDEAASSIAHALHAMGEEGDLQGVAVCLTLQAGILWPLGDPTRARDVYAQAITAFEVLGDDQGVAIPLGNLAELEFVQGDAQLALRYATEALKVAQSAKNPLNLAIVQNDISAYRIALGDLDGARESSRFAMRAAQAAQRPIQIAVAAMHLALSTAHPGDAPRQARLLGYMNATYKQYGVKVEAAERLSYQKLASMLHQRLSEGEITKLMNEGAAWSEDQAVEEALKG